MALLIGAGLAALGRVAGPAALALIVLAGLPAQLGERGPDGHSDNIRGMDQIIAQHARPGDGVIYPQGPGMTSFAAAYPYGLARLRDLSAGVSPAQAGTVSGTNAPWPVVRGRLSQVGRVWVAETNAPLPGRPLVLRGEPFQLIHRWQVSDIWLWLYQSQHGREHRPDADLPGSAGTARGPAGASRQAPEPSGPTSNGGVGRPRARASRAAAGPGR